MKHSFSVLLFLVGSFLGHARTRAGKQDLEGRAGDSGQQRATAGAEQFASLANEERKLLDGSQGLLNDVQTLKATADESTDTVVAAKLQRLMDNFSDAQKEIVRSESEVVSHASHLAASLPNTKPRVVLALTQATQREGVGTRDPVRRAKLAEQALSQIRDAKSEVRAAYGSDSGTAEKVMAMMDKLQNSMQGLEKGADEDAKFFGHTVAQMKADEAKTFAKDEGAAGTTPTKDEEVKTFIQFGNDESAAGTTPTKDEEVSLAQTSAVVEQSPLASLVKQAIARLIRPSGRRNLRAPQAKVLGLRGSGGSLAH